MNSSADKLGILLAEIADLTKLADEIKNDFKAQYTATGVKVFEGDMFKSTVVDADRATVDYKAILKELNVDAKLIAKYTTYNLVLSVKTTSR